MSAPLATSWRGLIAVTTCNREVYLRRCLPHLAKATSTDPRLSVVISLDGDDEATRKLCDRWQAPLIFSETREGVGLSKNRVLELFPDYDYYFFVEDDVEVMDGSLFAIHVALAQGLDIHHMSLFEPRIAREAVGESSLLNCKVRHYQYGGASLSFFTRHGLDRVGGWHPDFATYRRWGHTEHSYRFPRAGLAPAPFSLALCLTSTCAWHSPASVTHSRGISHDDLGIAAPERALMQQKLKFVPVQTLAPYHYNNVPLGPLDMLADAVGRRDRYPLLLGSERRRAYSDYFVWLLRNARNPVGRVVAGATAGVLSPSNPEWRHEVKTLLRR